jgi:hypothetical protein
MTSVPAESPLAVAPPGFPIEGERGRRRPMLRVVGAQILGETKKRGVSIAHAAFSQTAATCFSKRLEPSPPPVCEVLSPKISKFAEISGPAVSRLAPYLHDRGAAGLCSGPAALIWMKSRDGGYD